MKNELKVTRIRKGFAGYGHNKIIVTVTGKLVNVHNEIETVEDYDLQCKSSDTMATDAFFDEMFDEITDNVNSYYETRYEAAQALINQTLRANQVDSSYSIEIEGLLTPQEVKVMRSEILADS